LDVFHGGELSQISVPIIPPRFWNSLNLKRQD
jgi:hypothetical protein